MHYASCQNSCNGKVILRCKTCREEVDIYSRFWQRMLRDHPTFGLHDQTMQKEVLKERLGNLSLVRTKDICRSNKGLTKIQSKHV